ANDDFADTDGNNPVDIPVLSNDSAQAGINVHSLAIVASPAHGSVFVNRSTGVVTYAAAGNFGGTDTFQYTFPDNLGTVTNPATATWMLNHRNANDNSPPPTAGHPLTTNVLETDTDPAGTDQTAPATVKIGPLPQHGTAAVASNGVVTYTPQDGFSGTD